MKKTLLFLSALGSLMVFSQEYEFGNTITKSDSKNFARAAKSTDRVNPCSTVVINSTEAQGGMAIIGTFQKAAMDIPIAKNQTIKINTIYVTLASKLPPTFVNLIFYDNIFWQPEDPDEQPAFVPNQELFSVTDCSIESFEEVGFEPQHQFVVRKIKIKLQNPIVLDGSMSNDRIWMRTLSNADYWASASHLNPDGQGDVGEGLAFGRRLGGWGQLPTRELIYELDAQCDFLNVADNSVKSKVNIYPNPAQDYIEFKNLESMKIVSVNIYDASGKAVKSINGNQSRVNVQDLPKGVYIVKAKTSSHITLTDKLIKK